jgi:hypothetical protein
MDIRLLCCLGSLLLATNPAIAADIKKWTDQDGQVHFGNLAPHGVENVDITPEITTTAPSPDNTLNRIMRPGELRMIKNYEQRGKRLTKAKRESSIRNKLEKRRVASTQKSCDYHRRQKNSLKQKLRAGCSRSERNRIEEKLDMHNLKIEEYCDK